MNKIKSKLISMLGGVTLPDADKMVIDSVNQLKKDIENSSPDDRFIFGDYVHVKDIMCGKVYFHLCKNVSVSSCIMKDQDLIQAGKKLIDAIDNHYPDSPEFAELYCDAKELLGIKS